MWNTKKSLKIIFFLDEFEIKRLFKKNNISTL